MANVSVIQRHAHLAGAVKLEFVNGREGKIAKAEQEELLRLRRELARVTQERDFLKRAAAIFAKEHK